MGASREGSVFKKSIFGQTPRLYNRSATLDDPDQDDDDSQDKQNMNEAAQGEGSYESQEPQDQKDRCKRDK
jgi:hypothetical protein